MTTTPDPIAQLIDLAHRIGRPGNLAILGEGNVSTLVSEGVMAVKASGSSLATLDAGGIAHCHLAKLLPAMTGPQLPDNQIDQVLLDSRVTPESRKPSTEGFFHAGLLSLPGIKFVAHCHPNAVNAVLCSPVAEKFAKHRQCPDEVVCCGSESLLLPYIDPGLALSRAMIPAVQEFAARTGRLPRVILLANHGVICPAGTVEGAWAALAMCVKSAEIFAGAERLGGAISLSAADIARLDNRPDELYRRSVLKL